MLIRFAIEPAAIVQSGHVSPRETQVLHKRLIKLWEQFGLLIDPGKGQGSISSKFDDPTLRPVSRIWRDAWKARQRCRRIHHSDPDLVDWNTMDSSADLAACQDVIRVAFVETVRGIAYLGIPDAGATYKMDCGEVEAVLFPYADQSTAFSEMLGRSETKVIVSGTPVVQIWQEWFGPLAQHAERIIFLDRYLFAHKNVAGLTNILSFLSGDAPGCAIDVYASNPDTLQGQHLSRSEFIAQLESHLNSVCSPLGNVNVYLVRDDVMTRDRYVSFDECAFHSGHGLPEIFADSVLVGDQPCSLDATSNGFMKTILGETARIGAEYNVILTFRRDVAGNWETFTSTN